MPATALHHCIGFHARTHTHTFIYMHQLWPQVTAFTPLFIRWEATVWLMDGEKKKKKRREEKTGQNNETSAGWRHQSPQSSTYVNKREGNQTSSSLHTQMPWLYLDTQKYTHVVSGQRSPPHRYHLKEKKRLKARDKDDQFLSVIRVLCSHKFRFGQ